MVVTNGFKFDIFIFFIILEKPLICLSVINVNNILY